MEIFQTPYINILLETSESLLKIYWNENSEHIDTEDFKDINLKYVEWIQTHNFTKMLLDTQRFRFAIYPELQEWVATEILPALIEKGLKATAFLTSEELIAQLSIEQTMEENAEISQAFMLRYFSDESQAKNWLSTL